MGGGELTKGDEAKPDDDAEQRTTKTRSSTPEIDLTAQAEYERINSTCSHDVTVMARIKAPEEDDESRRAAVNICAVIDRSGSMKPNIALMQETLRFVVQQLRPEDKLSLITFDHQVVTELPLMNMNSAGKSQAEGAIDKLRERGHTNLSGGLFAGLDQIFKLRPEEVARVESVLLFTDGKANVGVTKTNQLAKATSSVLRQINRQCSVFTFGFGHEHDADMLKSIASAGNGSYYYLDGSDSIPGSFCDCLGGLLSVAAQNLRLHVSAVGECSIGRLMTSYKVATVQERKVYEVTIPDIYCEEEKDVLCMVKVPKCSIDLSEAQQLPLVTFQLDCFNVLTCTSVTLTATASVQAIPNYPEVRSGLNADIELQRNRCEAVEALNQATQLANAGEYDAARSALHGCVVQIKGSSTADHDLSRHLVGTLEESETGLRDRTTYVKIGHKMMSNFSDAHAQQRSNRVMLAKASSAAAVVAVGGAASVSLRAASADDDDELYSPYCVASKKKMIEKYKKMKKK